MKKQAAMMVLVASALAAAMPAQARDDKLMMNIAEAMNDNDAKNVLGDSVQFFFGNQATPKVVERLVTDQTSQKTNSFGKTPQRSCNWAFLSAMKQLQKRANSVGANAVINIQSNYNNKPMSSETEFECHDGAIMSGVALKGEFVKVK